MSFSSVAAGRRTAKLAIFGVAVFSALVLALHFVANAQRQRDQQELRTEVITTATALRSRLQGELNANVFLANGLVAYVMAVKPRRDPELHTALKALYRFGRHIRNIGVAPDNRISDVYPRAGNEAAIGLRYPDVPSQWPAVKRAIETRSTVLAGPVKLRQGGSGLISRTPVFLEDGRYWGVLSLVLDSDSLFSAVGLSDPVIDKVRFAIRGKDGLGAKGAVFFGSPALFSDDAVTLNLEIPGGTWQIAAAPVGGWHGADRRTTVVELGGLVLVVLLTFIVVSYVHGRTRIETNERRLRAFLDTTRDGVVVIDDQGIVQEFNHGAERLFGYSAHEMINTPLSKLMPSSAARQHDGYVRRSRSAHARTMAPGENLIGLRRDGSEFPIEVSVGEAYISGSRIHVGVIRDISERKAFEQRLMELATTDSLTGVLNRRALMAAAREMMLLAQRHSRPLSLLLIDADHFKAINDQHGHDSGDQALIELTHVVQACLRATDRLGRYGGEEFIALLPETDRQQANEVAQRILSAVREICIEGDSEQSITVTVSIGIASADADAADVGVLIRRADEALYQAKGQGRDCAVSDRPSA